MSALKVGNLTIEWLGHASFKIIGGKTIYIDPWELRDAEKDADFILITHEHRDHFSLQDIHQISNAKTKVISNYQVCNQIKECIPIEPYQTLEFEGITVQGFPAYNKNKYRSPGIPYHPKADQKLGFVIEIDGVKVYLAGDTDFLNQMRGLEVDVAIVPIGGTFTMGPKEAASAVNSFKPKLAIPMHWGKIVGTEVEAKRFAELCEVPVEIMEPAEG